MNIRLNAVDIFCIEKKRIYLRRVLSFCGIIIISLKIHVIVHL